MPPITKTNDQAIAEAIEKSSKRTAEEIFEKINTGENTGGSKVQQILKNVNKRPDDTDIEKKLEERLKTEREKDKQEIEKERERLHKELADDEIFCPSCKKGHVHVLKSASSGRVKCNGEGCNTEYNLIPQPTKDDYKCTTCNLPHKKPAKSDDDDECPLCGNKEFVKFDWSKIIDKKRKR